jgi:diphthamide synthase (EF-2-diphthine--ammonia ligase)
MAQHKVLGLVSGGKDSCFNLLHCVANGHEVVALGTLTPESGTGESLRQQTLPQPHVSGEADSGV